jgi:hypothetical protein
VKVVIKNGRLYLQILQKGVVSKRLLMYYFNLFKMFTVAKTEAGGIDTSESIPGILKL